MGFLSTGITVWGHFRIGAASGVPSARQLAVALHPSRVRLPVALLIIGVGLAPFAPAIADDLGVFGISSDPLAVILGAATPLAFWPAAHCSGWNLEGSKDWEQKRQQRCGKRGFLRIGQKPDPLRKSEYRNCYRVAYRVPARGAVSAPPLGGGALLLSSVSRLRGRCSVVPAYRAEIGTISARPLTEWVNGTARLSGSKPDVLHRVAWTTGQA